MHPMPFLAQDSLVSRVVLLVIRTRRYRAAFRDSVRPDEESCISVEEPALAAPFSSEGASRSCSIFLRAPRRLACVLSAEQKRV